MENTEKNNDKRYNYFKQYRINNNDKIKKSQKEYYEIRQNKNIFCEYCDKNNKGASYYYHVKTKMHKENYFKNFNISSNSTTIYNDKNIENIENIKDIEKY